MTQTQAKCGYCITMTPGLVSEGVYPLSANAFKRGEIERADHDPAIWATREQATQAMLSLVPKGKDPAVWAGLAVASAYDHCVEDIVHGWAEGMDGFVVPEYHPQYTLKPETSNDNQSN